MTRVVVLGCGLIGSTIARDLASDPDFDVLVADVNAENLAVTARRAELETRQCDLSSPEAIRALAEEADGIVGALPSAFGHMALRAVAASGKPYCDISFMAEDPRSLDAFAREHGTTAVVDCGVAPGLANMIIGYECEALDQVEDVLFYVGGLPRERRWPYQYKAPFAPSDVIEEYTRPARFREHGQLVVRPALSDPELLDVPTVGTLEAFNTDGLRSLLDTIDAPNVREKTLRWPGHIELMRVLRETGFFDKELVQVGDLSISPLAVTSRLLFDRWRLEPGENEFTYLRVEVVGQKDGRARRSVTTLLDEYDAATDEHSMARTTGYPCAIVMRMLLDGTLTEPGVLVPEQIGALPGVFERTVRELAERGVRLEKG